MFGMVDEPVHVESRGVEVTRRRHAHRVCAGSVDLCFSIPVGNHRLTDKEAIDRDIGSLYDPVTG